MNLKDLNLIYYLSQVRDLCTYPCVPILFLELIEFGNYNESLLSTFKQDEKEMSIDDLAEFLV